MRDESIDGAGGRIWRVVGVAVVRTCIFSHALEAKALAMLCAFAGQVGSCRKNFRSWMS